MNNDAHMILFAEIQYCTIAMRIRVGTRLGSLRHRRHIRPLQVTVESHLIVPLASGVKFAPPATATFYAEGTNKVCAYGEADINRDHTRLGHLLFPELRFRPTTRPRRKPLSHLKCPTHISTCSTHTNTCLTPTNSVISSTRAWWQVSVCRVFMAHTQTNRRPRKSSRILPWAITWRHMPW